MCGRVGMHVSVMNREYWTHRLTIVSAAVLFAASAAVSAQSEPQKVLTIGKIEVRVGRPLRIAPGETESQITKRLHDEVERLMNGGDTCWKQSPANPVARRELPALTGQ